MPEGYNAAKQGPRELPDGHPHKGGAVFFKPKSATAAQPPSADPVEEFHPGRRETAGERCPAIAPRGWMRQFRARSSAMAESRNCYVPLRPAITGSQTAPIHLTPASSRIRRSPRPHKATNRRSSLHFRLGSNVNSQLMVKKPNKNNDTILRLRAG